MKYLTEEEFDRKYWVKRSVARAYLRRAAETDDRKAAAKLAINARVILENLPDKEKCKTQCCEDCEGQSLATECDYERWRGQLVYVRQRVFCGTCKVHDPTFVERYCVHSYQL